MKTILSGIQPTGQPSLGNFIGAILPQVSMQDEADVTYFIADLHSLTVRPNPKDLRENSYGVAAWYLAAGLNPEKATLFLQSHVRAHAEMGWILGTFTQMGELERMTQFKDKSAKHKGNINAGLFTYPALQAADILLYNVDAVPVGEDQEQHLELARNVAQRFNHYCTPTDDPNAKPVFKLPKTMLPKTGARIKDLQDPTSKMSKSSEGKGTIFMLDDMNVIRKKIKSAVTDSLGVVKYDPENQAGVANLLEIYATMKHISIAEAEAHFEGSQYGNFKAEVAEAVVEVIEPIQTRYKELMANKNELHAILVKGAEKASIRADRMLQKVQKKVGLVPLSK